MILHYTFAANMPGRFLLHRAYESPANSAWMIGALCVAMVALTWLTMALPLCWCAGNCCRWLRR